MGLYSQESDKRDASSRRSVTAALARLLTSRKDEKSPRSSRLFCSDTPIDEEEAEKLMGVAVVVCPLLYSAAEDEEGRRIDFSSAEDAVDGLRVERCEPFGSSKREPEERPICETVADARDRERLLREKEEC